MDRVALLNIRLAIKARARRDARQTRWQIHARRADRKARRSQNERLLTAQIRQAKLTHENFLREYGDAVKGVPLVIYEGRVNRQSKRPFKLAP